MPRSPSRLRRDLRRRAPRGFVEVRLPGPPAGAGITVEIGGAVLRVERAFDPAALACVLAALRALRRSAC
jgi:hypothetical protein